ncbi:MAG: LCP family protein [Nocardioidaceae bacterium]
MFLAWLLFLVAVPMWAWSQLAQVDAEPNGTRPAGTPGATYLLVGSDSREGMSKEEEADLGTGDAEGERTDTILLLHVPDGDGPKLLLSIPRDSFVEIPGHGQNKINAAYSLGGPDLLVETIEQATEVRVDSYLEVGFGGFVEIVDALGGIEICPTEAIDDPKAGGLQLDKGCSDVDGRQALGYSRSRDFKLGDITRALHQREVITAVGQKAAAWQTVVLPWRYFRINSAAADTVRIGEDVGPIDVAKFAWAMARPGSDAKRCVVPYTSLGQQTSAGSAVIWDDERAGAIFTAIREDDTGSISCAPQ